MDNNIETTPILDSSLIIQSKCFDRRVNSPQKQYQYKVIDCGDYVQIYEFEDIKKKKENGWDNYDYKKIDTDNLTKKEKPMLHDIELKNIIRSKLECQRIAKCNISKWKSFITLTFADNITEIDEANKQFNIWRTAIKQVKPDFIYLAVPEFQKRGAVHYHVLSNISLEDKNIITPQEDNPEYYDVKYWKYGFSAFDDVSGDVKKIIGYISKYMTKDADSRLYGRRRYLCSRDIEKPIIQFLEYDELLSIYDFDNFYNLDYNNKYEDTYTKSSINYMEFKKKTKVNIIYRKEN